MKKQISTKFLKRIANIFLNPGVTNSEAFTKYFKVVRECNYMAEEINTFSEKSARQKCTLSRMEYQKFFMKFYAEGLPDLVDSKQFIFQHFFRNIPFVYFWKGEQNAENWIKVESGAEAPIIFKVIGAQNTYYLSTKAVFQNPIRIEKNEHTKIVNFVFSLINFNDCNFSFEGENKESIWQLFEIIKNYFSALLVDLNTQQQLQIAQMAHLKLGDANSFVTDSVVTDAVLKKLKDFALQFDKREHLAQFERVCFDFYKKQLTQENEREFFQALKKNQENADFLKNLFLLFKRAFIITAVQFFDINQNSTNYITFEAFGSTFISVYHNLFLNSLQEAAKESIKTIFRSLSKNSQFLIKIGLTFASFFELLFKPIMVQNKAPIEGGQGIKISYTFLTLTYKEIFSVYLKMAYRLPLRFIEPTPWKLTKNNQQNHNNNFTGGYECNVRFQLRPLIYNKINKHKVDFMIDSEDKISPVIQALNKAQNMPFIINQKQISFYKRNCQTISEKTYLEMKSKAKLTVQDQQEISKYLDNYFVLDDLAKLGAMYNTEAQKVAALLYTNLQNFETVTGFSLKRLGILLEQSNYFPEDFLLYAPLCLEWRLRFCPMSSIGYLSHDFIRSCMSSPYLYFIPKEKLWELIKELCMQTVDGSQILQEPFFQAADASEEEIERFVLQHFPKNKFLMFRLFSEFFAARKQSLNNNFGEIAEMTYTDFLLGLDNTASGYQLQQISLLNGYYKKELNFITDKPVGDIYHTIGCSFINFLKNATTGLEQSYEFLQSEKLLGEASREKIVIKYSKNPNLILKTQKVNEEPHLEAGGEDLKIGGKKKKEFRITTLPATYGFLLIKEILTQLTGPQLRKLVKSIAMPAAYNATYDSLKDPVTANLNSFDIDTQYKSALIRLLINELLAFINEGKDKMNLMVFNRFFKKLAILFKKEKKELFWYHLSGPKIIPGYMKSKEEDSFRIFITIKNPNKNEKSVRRNINLAQLIKDENRLQIALSPNFTHSLDSAIIHHIILNLPCNYVFTIHDCFYLRLCDIDYFEQNYAAYLEAVLKFKPKYKTDDHFHFLVEYLPVFFSQLNLTEAEVSKFIKEYLQNRELSCFSEITWSELRKGKFLNFK